MPSNPPVKKKRICIIGAGAAGQNKFAYSCIEYIFIKILSSLFKAVRVLGMRVFYFFYSPITNC